MLRAHPKAQRKKRGNIKTTSRRGTGPSMSRVAFALEKCWDRMMTPENYDGIRGSLMKIERLISRLKIKEVTWIDDPDERIPPVRLDIFVLAMVANIFKPTVERVEAAFRHYYRLYDFSSHRKVVLSPGGGFEAVGRPPTHVEPSYETSGKQLHL
ncbi:hypothetical protein K440DRAFT_223686 [Wilcoxina mikolae CBS 423.85]|nr:hypothetical protein K440DRAFT_223686 [Wilcoxina mikolae CBS 423.85]